MLKVLLITSEVTFIPRNYDGFLEALFSSFHKEQNVSGKPNVIIHLGVFKNNHPSLIAKSIGLILVGARGIGLHLLKNSLTAFISKKRKILDHYQVHHEYFTDANDPHLIQYVKDHQIDLIINARTRSIYKTKILKSPRLGCLNIHHGLLPDNRGTMCDLWAMYYGEPTGFSVHLMDKKIDNGDIVKKVETTHLNQRNYPQFLYESSKLEGSVIGELLKKINQENEIPIELKNNSIRPRYTKNPNFNEIRMMLLKGLTL